MLNIIFYPDQEKEPVYVELSDSFYEWLARSRFSKIGRSSAVTLTIEGEVLELPVVQLEQLIRRELSKFFRDQIVAETDVVLDGIEKMGGKEDYRTLTYRLRKLQELRKCVENPDFLYLQRV